MVRKAFTPEQIINKLSKRITGWRKEYSGMRLEQAKRLKELEKENSRLKKLVADISLDNAILKEAARGNS